MLLEYLKTYKAQVFSRGQAAKVFREVHDQQRAVCVIKNSEPYVAILPHDLYLQLIKNADQNEASSGEKK